MGPPDDWITEPNDIALDRFFHALGVLQSRWNVAELILQQLAWFVMGVAPTIGAAITFDMGNIGRANLILTVARGDVKIPAVTEFFEFCVKLFHANRDNRNFLAHCRFMHVTNAPAGLLMAMQKFAADGKFRTRIYTATLDEIRGVADEIEAMNRFFRSFLDWLETMPDHELIAQLAKPPLPRSLADRVPSYDPADPEKRVTFPGSRRTQKSPRARKPSARQRRAGHL